jgi:HNH endonuclease
MTRKTKPTSNMVQCACGCGGWRALRARVDVPGKEHHYLSGHNPHWTASRARIEGVCPNCQKPFVPTRGSMGNATYQNKFCTRSCWLEYNHGENNGSYKATPDQPLKGRTSINRYALRRDKNKCRVCGYSDVVEVHHIVRVTDGGTNTLDNVITLCPNHHASHHFGSLTTETLRALLVT